jgi:hypothetical protein
MNWEALKEKYLNYPFNFDAIMPKITTKDGEYCVEYKLPITLFDGWQVHDKKTGVFLGWVNAKNKTIEKVVVSEIVKEGEVK